MNLIVLLCISIHTCYIGSKVVLSLLALEIGASQFVIGILVALSVGEWEMGNRKWRRAQRRSHHTLFTIHHSLEIAAVTRLSRACAVPL